MWIGSPLLTSSVAKILRKSWAVNSRPRNAGLVSASTAVGVRDLTLCSLS